MITAVLTFPSLLLMDPKGDTVSWTTLITDLASLDAGCCIQAIRWRRSCNGGRPWVCPQMLQQGLKNSTIFG